MSSSLHSSSDSTPSTDGSPTSPSSSSSASSSSQAPAHSIPGFVRGTVISLVHLCRSVPLLPVTILSAFAVALLWSARPWTQPNGAQPIQAQGQGHPLLPSNPSIGQLVVFALVLVTVVASLKGMIEDLKKGHVGVDVLAIVAMLATLAVEEYWAAWTVVLMVWSGEAIERFAQAKAEGNLTALMSAVPQTAHVGGATVPAENVRIGDVLTVLPGETVPVDGALMSASATLDLSAINGEPVPRQILQGAKVPSGAVNGSTALEMRASQLAQDSQYQRILELVASARESRATVVKTADMLAVPFTVLSFAIAGVAWFVSGVPERFAQVLVLATPCPLLIAAPVAYMAGTGRLAKSGIVIKAQEVLENLGRVSHIFFDKTGTLTVSKPQVVRVELVHGARDAADGSIGESNAADGADGVNTADAANTMADTHNRQRMVGASAVTPLDADHMLALAGALESYSVHILAQGIVAAGGRAARRLKQVDDRHGSSFDATAVTDVHEDAGGGVRGEIVGMQVRIGRLGYAVGAQGDTPIGAGAGAGAKGSEGGSRNDFAPLRPDEMGTYMSIDGRLVARIVMRDVPRPNAKAALARLRKVGVSRLSMLTGDKIASAQAIAGEVGIDDVRAELLPKDKLDAVEEAQHDAVAAAPWWSRLVAALTGESLTKPITMMVGDGVNDAPVLAAADIGVAMSDGTSTAAAQSAQVVIMNDDIAMVPHAIEVARQTKRVMLQAVLGGLALAVVGMLVAAFGVIPAVIGAIGQEAIDVVSILWALTAMLERRR